jgi:NhaA family Na+:H+ antiporter
MSEKSRIYKTLKNPPIVKVMSPLQRFIEKEATSSKILLVCILLGLLWANIPWGNTYEVFWNTELSLTFWKIDLTQPLIWWINDGLMTIFFFVIGLELKREIIIGGLNDKKDAIYAILTGISGMIIPIIFFMTINYPRFESFKGWSIPISTDIAIALGILSLFSYNIPRKIKLMLTSMAIIDDVGSIIIISIFYSHSINWLFFGLSFVVIAILVVSNVVGIRNPLFYILPGIVLWFFTLTSGVHPTIAGVIVAATIPATKRIDLCDFYEMSKKSYTDIAEIEFDPDEVSCYNRVVAQVHALEKGFRNIRTPLDIIEHRLIGWVAFLIVPVFVLANSGINFFTLNTNPFTSRLFWGIIVGLVIGKPVGVLLVTVIAMKSKLFVKPSNVNWHHITGMSFLRGIGFTMSSFLAGLAFYSDLELLSIAKIAILIGSTLSAGIGYILLKLSLKKLKSEVKTGE